MVDCYPKELSLLGLKFELHKKIKRKLVKGRKQEGVELKGD